MHPSQELRELERVIQRKLSALIDGEMNCAQITQAQCHALVEIGRAGSISLNDLSEMLNVENCTMSRTLNKLVDNGYAIREINANDRRYIKITLTEKGNDIFERVETNIDAHFRTIYNAIPKEKRDQVFESLNLLVNAVSAGYILHHTAKAENEYDPQAL
ncbi:MAG: MarR family winged helix-turn-helix transcriptional regulator [Anaerofustis sp.]